MPADAIGVTDQYISISKAATYVPQGLQGLFNRLTGTVIVPVRRDLAQYPEDWSEVVRASARAMQARIDAQARGVQSLGGQDWFHEAYFVQGRYEARAYDAGLVNQLGTAGSDTLTGAAGNDGLFGQDGADTLLGGAGADGLSGGAGADRLDGGAGADRMGGGAGDDTYIVDNALDYIAEAAGQGRDRVQSSVSYALGQNLTGLYKQLYDNVEDLVLTGAGPIDGTGNALDNAIAGTSAANVLAGGAGNDTLMGGAGADTYRFNRGDGQDVISDGESFSTSVDVLQFGAGIGSNQLWLRKVAAASPLDRYDLEVQLMGTGDKVTIAGWERAGGFAPYDPNANRIEQIKSSDGKTLSDTKVAQLVQAMASMAPPSGATSWSQLSASQQTQLQALGAWA